MRFSVLALVLLLSACRSPQQETSTAVIPESTRQQFEQRIAESILTETSTQLGMLNGPERHYFLHNKVEQFRTSVDASKISSATRNELAILEFLASTEGLTQQTDNFAARLYALSSIRISPVVLGETIQSDLDRIDQAIVALTAKNEPDSFELEAHMRSVRDSAHYPENSFEGRQAYLDRLSQAMLESQVDWFDTYSVYEPSALSISGEEDSEFSFVYGPSGLAINISEVDDLPGFELPALAVFYGFPGLQSYNRIHSESLRKHLVMPGYTHGWAAFLLEEISTRDVDGVRGYLYFLRLLESFALADIKLASGEWALSDAEDYITSHTPYSRHRVRLMLQQLISQPGHYASVIAGKLKFAELHQQCRARNGNCAADFNQRVIDLGPLPFETLEKLMNQ